VVPGAGSASASSALAFELLESKLLPPPGRVGSVSRAAIIDRLEARDAARVVCVSAGPGWGKTTLLAQWAARARRPFAWVGVDETDNDPIVLLTYVAVALDRVAPLDGSVFGALASPGVSVEATVVPRLGAALAAMGRPVVLVLDDLHVLENPVCLDAIAALTRHVPAGSQMALSARGRPALPLDALRARGLVLEIGPRDLRMDTAEARQLLTAAGADLPDERVTRFTEETEGWAAGLYLAALSIRVRGVDAGGAAPLSGSDRLVSGYLREELLAHAPPDELRFLTRTAVLERMSGPLCDAVLETSGSAAILESLAGANLFLVPLDGTRELYRYHRLFGGLLRAELARTEPELVPLLLARAADWCEDNGRPETAIGYAQQAGDVDRVARLVEACGQPAHQSGRVATAERWLAWLEEHGALERNAAVAVLGALIAAVQGHPAAAERWADAAERARYDGTLYDGSSSIDSWRALLSAMLCGTGLARMRADAEFAVQMLARGSQFWPTALLLVAISRLLASEVDQADDLLADVAEAGLELGVPEPVGVALGERAAIAIARGAWVDAEELADRAVLVTRRARIDEYPTSALAHAVAVRVALHRGEAPRAHALLTRAQRLRGGLTYATPYLAIQTRLELARAYLTVADAGGARTMLREIDALLRRRPNLGTLISQAEELRTSLQTMRAQAPGASTLTEAELRVLPYLATHLSFREIAERLFLSRHTVKSHAIAIYRKLSVASRTDAVERARDLGLL
jgi:LuxR family maltose regulon positive regulatory protein